MSVHEILIAVMAAFAALGALDRILGNRLGLAKEFEEGIMAISPGRRLYGTPAADAGRMSIDRATALIFFYNGLSRMGDVCSRIDHIEPGYISATSLNRVMTLTPVWRVTTDTGTYQLDLVGGDLERVG